MIKKLKTGTTRIGTQFLPFRRIVILCLFLNSLFYLYSNDYTVPKEVLIFFSHVQGTPWQEQMSLSLYSDLQNDEALDVNITTDYPWIEPDQDEEYNENLFNFYIHKYQTRKVDLIISVSTASTRFLLEYSDELFPGIPVVALPGPDAELLEQVKLKSGWAVVFSEKRIKETLDMALTVLPQTETIAVVSGSSDSGLVFAENTREILDQDFHDYSIKYITDRSMSDILSGVAHLPRRTIILYLTTLTDSTGESFVPKQILKDITEAANAPVFGLWDTLLNSGITGGYMVSPELDGKSLAETALRVLHGENINSLPVSNTQNGYYFNWSQLKKWHIRESDLPEGSIVVNRELSFWDLYYKQIIIIFSIIVLQSVFIIVLLFLQTRLRMVKRALVKSHEDLEIKVSERTADLSEANLKLEREIDQRKEAKQLVDKLLEEKEVILHEVHHRIKNNMMTLMSLLSLQTDRLENPQAAKILENAAHRINSMMILYDKLYRGSDFKDINIKSYLHDLISEILMVNDITGKIKVKSDLQDFTLDSRIVFNIGIIINELITNSVKYAFSSSMTDAVVSVSALKTDNRVTILYSDNGEGFPDDLPSEGFGLSLVEILAQQIDASVIKGTEEGASYVFEFRA